MKYDEISLKDEAQEQALCITRVDRCRSNKKSNGTALVSMCWVYIKRNEL